MTFSNIFFLKFLIFKILYFLKICPVFVEAVHDFGRLCDDLICNLFVTSKNETMNSPIHQLKCCKMFLK